MINLFFFLRFKSQLRRTRPDIIWQIDELLAKAINDAGGKVTGDRFVISAAFNEDRIGFWLDMFILIENIKKKIEESEELFGYSFIICGKSPDSPELLSRFLANNSGIFVDERTAIKLVPYAAFEKPSEWMKNIKKRKYGSGNFYKIKELKTFKSFARNDHVLQNDVIKIYNREKGKNTLILGQSCLHLRGGLYKYNEQINEDFPPLTVCFERIGLGALVDIWSHDIRSLGGGQNVEEIDNLWEFLFRERIRDEVSDYISRCTRRFLLLVFQFYLDAANRQEQMPVLMLENIHLAEKKVIALLLDTLAEVNQGYREILLLGTGDDNISQERLKQYEEIFESVITLETKIDRIYFPKLSVDLWEIIYAISLLSRYFSPEFFQRLFEETSLNPVMITRAFSILYSLGIINTLSEPRLINRHFEEYAVRILEEKAEKVRAFVCARLLNWAVKRNINTCYRLLTEITILDGTKKIDDLLLLKSFYSDIVNQTTSGIERAMNSEQFDEKYSMKADLIRQIFNTSTALTSGNENDIEQVFNNNKLNEIILSGDAFPLLKAQLIVNNCSYYLGRHDLPEAAEKAKEAILIGQNKSSFCLPQSYRLYSLVCLTKKNVNETIEYLGFALSNSEKNGNYHEQAVCAYYAAAAYFLYGDVFRAANYTRKSIENALAAGCPDWADRALFLEGRINFELGKYKEAHNIFEKLCKEPYGSMTCDKENMLSAWIYRSKIYLRDSNAIKPEPAIHDADLFEIEAAYLSGDFKKAVELSASVNNPFTEGSFLYTEQADWKSGFAQCEHLYFTHGEIQNRMLTLFHSLALSRLSGKYFFNENQGSGEQAIQGIQKIIRDEKLCEMDPWDAFYFYAKYCILQQCGASHVDMSTAVSMAFKRLQRRACRIEDIETRHQYLEGPRWSRELSLAAKEFKLI